MNHIFLLLIKLYKKLISPILPSSCRYFPSCSEYAKQAFESYPFHIAFYLSSKRILKCNPFFEGYEDPLPENFCKHRGIKK